MNNFSYPIDEERAASFEDRFHDLPTSLPSGLHPFRDPDHHNLVNALESHRMLLLGSYQGRAAYAAAFTLVFDNYFSSQRKRSLLLNRHSDLEIADLVANKFLEQPPQILLVPINRYCNLLGSLLNSEYSNLTQVRDRLESHSSYVIFAVNEDLLTHDIKARTCLRLHAVSHLHYLLSRDFPDRAKELEDRLLTAIKRKEVRIELRELEQLVSDRLAEGTAAFDTFLQEIEEANCPPLKMTTIDGTFSSRMRAKTRRVSQDL